MEYRMICPQKDRHGQVLGFSPLSKCIVWWMRDYVVAEQNLLEYDQGKAPLDQWLLSMALYNRRRRAYSTLRDVMKKIVGECWVDIRYRISWGAESGSAAWALARPLLPPDSKALRSESDIFATRARGSCGVDPGPVRLRIVTLSVSPMGDWLYAVRKRLVLVRSLMFSTFAMVRFTALAVWGGGTYLALMRPRKGSPGAAGVFEKIAPSSA